MHTYQNRCTVQKCHENKFCIDKPVDMVYLTSSLKVKMPCFGRMVEMEHYFQVIKKRNVTTVHENKEKIPFSLISQYKLNENCASHHSGKTHAKCNYNLLKSEKYPFYFAKNSPGYTANEEPGCLCLFFFFFFSF